MPMFWKILKAIQTNYLREYGLPVPRGVNSTQTNYLGDNLTNALSPFVRPMKIVSDIIIIIIIIIIAFLYFLRS